jgi:ribosomal protein S20
LSDWTGQETGYALMREVPIIPLSVNKILPYGFFKKYQALSFDTNDIEKSCSNIISTIKQNEKYGIILQNNAIDIFIKSEGFIEAKNNSALLLDYKSFTKAQLERILKACLENYEIYNSYGAAKNVKKIISKYQNIIDKKLSKEVIEKFVQSDVLK